MQMPSHPATDIEAVQRFQDSKDPDSFSLLYKRYAQKVYKKCFLLMRDERQAEDATQEIFAKVLLQLPQFRQEARFSTWLLSITHNYCIDCLRKKKRQQARFCNSLEMAQYIPAQESDYGQQEKNLAQLKEVLQALRPEEKHILRMKYLQELSIRDIAELMDTTESAVKMRLKRARAKARRLGGQLQQQEPILMYA